VSKSSSSKTSKPKPASRTAWKRVKALRDEDIDLSEVPELDATMLGRGVVRVGGKVVPPGKTRLTMYLDSAIVEYFRARAGARGYQTLINETLRHAIAQESLEDTMRRVLREEVASYKVRRR
jgi:uncharacterized protein (DUF4415 family)